MTDGRYLADRITEKFDDFHEGDYWILNGHKWTVLGVSTLERKKEVNVLND